jgi:RNA polymerase sigma factor (sigma-70 family)
MHDSHEALNDSSIARVLQDTAPALRAYLEPRIPDRLRSLISTDDLLQEVWIDAFQTLPGLSLSGENAQTRWLTTLARRKLINAIRSVQRLKRGGDREQARAQNRSASSIRDIIATVAAANRTPSSLVGVTEAADAVTAAISDLPPACRQAIWLRFIAGHPLQEVARRMQRTSSSVRALIFRGLRQMKNQLGSAAKFLTDASFS